ncbi:MAG: radical SAM protein [Pirellulaceae bacterium]
MTRIPEVPLAHLDDLWFQVTGTLCNLACHHCFISCHPTNRAFGFLTFERVKSLLAESVAWGVKEYYFTGGEPFLHPELVPMLCEALRYGPATVLTNGTVLKEPWLTELREADDASLYSLEWRVSIDGFSPDTNDPVRGEGTFARAMRGVSQLVAHGFLPIITAARTWPEGEDRRVVGQFVEMLRSLGYSRPRLKLLPALYLGAEAQRTRPYSVDERVTPEMLADFDPSTLVCHHSRTVTDRGIHVCPILIESPGSLLGHSLDAARQPARLTEGACFTCYQYGSICTNPSVAASRSRAASTSQVSRMDKSFNP